MPCVEYVRNQLRAQLAQLPAPVNKVEIVVPELPQEDPETEDMEVDAADRDKQRKLDEQQRAEKELRGRSQVNGGHWRNSVHFMQFRSALYTV